MDNLAEQLRALAAALPVSIPSLLTQAADAIEALELESRDFRGLRNKNRGLEATIEAQSRLLALAETLVTAAENTDSLSLAACGRRAIELREGAKAFTAAQAEYQTTGSVSCGECEVKDITIASRGTELKYVYSTVKSLETERDDLRRQLAETNSRMNYLNDEATAENTRAEIAEAECDEARRQLAETNHRLTVMTDSALKHHMDAEQARRQLAEAAESVKRNDDVIRQLEAEIDRWEAKQIEVISGCEKHMETETRMHREALADNAALVEAIGAALKPLLTECSCGYTIRDAEAIDQILEAALSQPHPGAPLLEELAALRKVAEEMRCYAGAFVDNDGNDVEPEKTAAYEALDAIRNREGS